MASIIGTIGDVAEALELSAGTIKRYIDKGKLPPPPTIKFGSGRMSNFPDERIEQTVLLACQISHSKKLYLFHLQLIDRLKELIISVDCAAVDDVNQRLTKRR